MVCILTESCCVHFPLFFLSSRWPSLFESCWQPKHQQHLEKAQCVEECVRTHEEYEDVCKVSRHHEFIAHVLQSRSSQRAIYYDMSDSALMTSESVPSAVRHPKKSNSTKLRHRAVICMMILSRWRERIHVKIRLLYVEMDERWSEAVLAAIKNFWVKGPSGWLHPGASSWVLSCRRRQSLACRDATKHVSAQSGCRRSVLFVSLTVCRSSYRLFFLLC